ncbi:hypothetical protein [Kitasatospora sp. NPDC056531]|uniref:hypothetical protein n=1 Tax=Kitasatospora sp. NPDC056531 TaxID=3345856 RepID=UPI0036C0939B
MTSAVEERSAPLLRRRARQFYPEGSQVVDGSQVVGATVAASDSASDSQTGSGSPGTVRPSDRHNRASSA